MSKKTVFFGAIFCGLALVAGVFLSGNVWAAGSSIPNVITYQGRLLDSSSVPITTAHDLRFSLWTSADFQEGTDDDGAANNINVSAPNYGGWNQEITSVTPNASGDFSVELTPPTPIDFASHKFLQVEIKANGAATSSYELMDIDGDSGAGVTDRQTVGAVLYAQTAAEVIDNAIDGGDIGIGTTAGDTLYYDGTDWVRLGIGTAGQVLTTNAGATAPEWISGEVGADVLNFSEFSDTLIVDGPTTITVDDTNTLTWTRSGTGLFQNFTDGIDTFGFYNIAGDGAGNKGPNDDLTANTGSLAVDTTNGKLYVKTDDADNTDWMVTKLVDPDVVPEFYYPFDVDLEWFASEDGGGWEDWAVGIYPSHNHSPLPPVGTQITKVKMEYTGAPTSNPDVFSWDILTNQITEVTATTNAANISGNVYEYDLVAPLTISKGEGLGFTARGDILDLSSADVNEVSTSTSTHRGYPIRYVDTAGATTTTSYVLGFHTENYKLGVSFVYTDADVGVAANAVAEDVLNFDKFSDAMALDASTSISLGTNTLTFPGSGEANLFFLDGANDRIGVGTAVPDQIFSLGSGDASKPGGGTWATFSDERIKTNIQPFDLGLETVLDLKPVTYRYNGKAIYPADDKDRVGVLAQDVVGTPLEQYTIDRHTAHMEGKETELLQWDGTALTYALINALQELDEKVEVLEKQKTSDENIEMMIEIMERMQDDIDQLKKENKELKDRVSQLDRANMTVSPLPPLEISRLQLDPLPPKSPQTVEIPKEEKKEVVTTQEEQPTSENLIISFLFPDMKF